MQKTVSVFIICICLALNATGRTNIVWRAGQTVGGDIAKEDCDKYFAIEDISDSVFKRIWLKSFRKDCTTRREDLRYLRILHANKDGKAQMGELICNKAIAQELIIIFKELYKAGYRIERMVLVDEYGADDEASMSANNTSCFNFRRVAGSKTLSKHSQGLAVDINPRYNPCVHTRTGRVQPTNGKAYAYRRKNTADGSIRLIDRNDLCYKLFIAHGFRWGGGWKRSVDYQHFEKVMR